MTQETCRFPSQLHALKKLLSSCCQWNSASKLQLQELLGHLNHAAAVVRPGRSFNSAIIKAMKRPRLPHQRTPLDVACKADISWWSLFVTDWNGVSILPQAQPTVTVASDASGSWGCGAFSQLQGDSSWKEVNIAAKALLSSHQQYWADSGWATC